MSKILSPGGEPPIESGTPYSWYADQKEALDAVVAELQGDDGVTDAEAAQDGGVTGRGEAGEEAAADAGTEAFYYEEDGHMAHYSGPLGTFAFDKTQFQLRKQPVPASGDRPETETTILKYVGTETDGKKIAIPEGCTDISMTFSGTGIKSAPKIPFGVKYAVGAFKDCNALTDARGNIPHLPPTVKDTSYMFAGCSRLGRGPDIPGTVETMDGMYYNCASLSRTPSVGRGVAHMDYAFAACPSLRDAPQVPGTVASARHATACCPGIDAEKDRKQERKLQAERARYERKLDGKGLGGMVGSAFSACLQYHALRKQGFGMMFAPIAVHMMRKNGQMGTTLASGVADVLQAGRGRTGMVLANGIRTRERTKRINREIDKRQKLAEWDAMYGDGTKSSRGVRAMAAKAADDQRHGTFYRMGLMPNSPDGWSMTQEEQEARIARRFKTQGVYEGMEAAVAAHWDDGKLDNAARARVADWYKERLDETLIYYRSAKAAITDGLTPYVTEELNGLRNAVGIGTAPLTDSVRKMQQEYGILDEGDLRRFDTALREMGLDPLTPSKGQRGRILSKDADSGYAEALSGRIYGEASGPMTRGDQAESRLGTVAGAGTARTGTGRDRGPTA